VSAFLRLLFAASLGAAFALAAAAAFPVQDDALSFSRLSCPPDLRVVVESRAAAGAAGALAIAIACGVLERPGALALSALALLNPLTLYAWRQGSAATLALGATAVLARAVIAHARERSHGSSVGLGIAAALAPLLSNSVLFAYPGMLALAPFLSPWRGLRRRAGFAAVVFAPAAMALLAILYLRWLTGAEVVFEPAAGSAGDLLLVLAGAVLIASIGEARSLLAAFLALLAGAAAVGALRPEIVREAVALFR
jgi:hypothetical protein